MESGEHSTLVQRAPRDDDNETEIENQHILSNTKTNESQTRDATTAGQNDADPNKRQAQENIGATVANAAVGRVVRLEEYENGYHFPPKYSKKETIRQALIDFWNFYNTGFGFFLTIYALNVVAWGGMLFLLLCNAAPVMCVPDCNDINSPRRIWVEVDSQILNALFCVTGFGLAPWRFRDAWHLTMYCWRKDITELRKLASIHRAWFRLPKSDTLPPSLGPKNIEGATNYPEESVPYPIESIPDAPPTGIRAKPTRMRKMYFVVWLNVWNTLFQVCLSSFMWAMNRIERPSWSTGLFVCLACIVSAAAGIIMGIESKRVKKIEGVSLTKRDLERLARDKELGIPHWNNINDKNPEEKDKKKKNNKGEVREKDSATRSDKSN